MGPKWSQPRNVLGEILDLDEFIRDWGWKKYKKSKLDNETNSKKMKREDLQIKVIWDDVVLTFDEPIYENDELKTLAETHLLFKTQFSNQADVSQLYALQTDRTTQSTCELTLTRTFSKGGEIATKLSLPPCVLKSHAGFPTQFPIARTTRQMIESEMKWAVDTKVTVKPWHRTEAQVNIVENIFSSHFTIHSQLIGKIQVLISSLVNSETIVKCFELPIHKILKHYKNINEYGIEIENKAIHLISSGKIIIRFGVDQKVTVSQVQLSDGAPSYYSSNDKSTID